MTAFTQEQAERLLRDFQRLYDQATTDADRAVYAERLREVRAGHTRNGHQASDSDRGEPSASKRSRWAYVSLADLIRESGIDLEPKGDDRLVGDHGPKHSSKSGLCLVVWPAEGRWWCSGCGERGDAVDWLRSWFGWGYGKAADFLRERFGPPEDERAWLEKLDGTAYRVRNGRLVWLKVENTKAGPVEVAVALANFVAHVVSEVVSDDGSGEVKRGLAVTGRLADGSALPEVRVPSERFGGMNWPVESWGMRANLSAGFGMRDKLREAIQHLSADAPVLHEYTHLGLREIDGRRVYLHAGGAVGRPDVRMELSPELRRYRLPVEPADVCQAMQTSLRLLDVAPRRQTLPLWAAVYLAPLSDILEPDFLLWLMGMTGSLKSTLLALFLCHYGTFDRKTLPGNFMSTDNALERRLFLAKDVLFGLDDYAPQSDAKLASQVERTAEGVIRRIGDREGRGRLRSDTSARPSYYPRGLVAATAEQEPPGTQSSVARTFVVPYLRDAADLNLVTAAQRDRGRLAHALRGYVGWVLEHYEELRETLPQARDAVRDQLLGQGHNRLPETIALLVVGLSTGLQYAVEVGAVSSSDADALVRETTAHLAELAAEHNRRTETRRPTLLFLNVLQDLFGQGKAYLRWRDGRSPAEPGRWGWERRQTTDDDGDVRTQAPSPRQGAEHLGWMTEDHLYLLPGAAFNTVARFVRAQGETFPVRESTLRDHLTREMFLMPDEQRSAALVKLEGHPRRVLRLDRHAIEERAWQVTAEVTDEQV